MMKKVPERLCSMLLFVCMLNFTCCKNGEKTQTPVITEPQANVVDMQETEELDENTEMAPQRKRKNVEHAIGLNTLGMEYYEKKEYGIAVDCLRRVHTPPFRAYSGYVP
jgi:hypothetical protein